MSNGGDGPGTLQSGKKDGRPSDHRAGVVSGAGGRGRQVLTARPPATPSPAIISPGSRGSVPTLHPLILGPGDLDHSLDDAGEDDLSKLEPLVMAERLTRSSRSSSRNRPGLARMCASRQMSRSAREAAGALCRGRSDDACPLQAGPSAGYAWLDRGNARRGTRRSSPFTAAPDGPAAASRTSCSSPSSRSLAASAK